MIFYGEGYINPVDSITVFEEEDDNEYFTGLLNKDGQPIYYTYSKLKIGFDLS